MAAILCDFKHDYKAAEASYREAIRLRPDDARFHAGFGFALWAQRRFDPAFAECREAIRIKPNIAFAHGNLATFLALHPDPANRHAVAALEHAQKAVELEPGTGSFVNTLAIAQYRAGLRDRALASFRKSIELNRGGDPYDWFFLAMIEHERANAAEAAHWFDKAVAWMKEQKSSDPDLLQCWTEAGRLLGRRGPEANTHKPAPDPKEKH